MTQIKVGPRLPYVVVELEGTVLRRQYVIESKTIGKGKREKTITERTEQFVEEPAGFMVYFPGGHAIRLNEKQLRQRGFDRPPVPINADGLSHALFTQEAAPILEKLRGEVIKSVTHRVGTQLLTRDPRVMEAA